MRYILYTEKKARKRDIYECVEDVLRLLEALNRIESSVFRWASISNPTGEVKLPPKIEKIEDLREIVKRVMYLDENCEEDVEGLGFSLTLSNGSKDQNRSVRLSMTNGVIDEASHNRVVLYVPEFVDLGCNDEVVQDLILSAVEAIDAEWGIFYRDIEGMRSGDTIFLDRAVFLRNSFIDCNRRRLKAKAEKLINLEIGTIFLKCIN